MPTLENLMLIDEKDLDNEAIGKLKTAYNRKDDDGTGRDLPEDLTVPLQYPYESIFYGSIVATRGRMPSTTSSLPPHEDKEEVAGGERKEYGAIGRWGDEESKWSSIEI